MNINLLKSKHAVKYYLTLIEINGYQILNIISEVEAARRTDT